MLNALTSHPHALKLPMEIRQDVLAAQLPISLIVSINAKSKMANAQSTLMESAQNVKETSSFINKFASLTLLVVFNIMERTVLNADQAMH